MTGLSRIITSFYRLARNVRIRTTYRVDYASRLLLACLLRVDPRTAKPDGSLCVSFVFGADDLDDDDRGAMRREEPLGDLK
jgi:hypothetical protein